MKYIDDEEKDIIESFENGEWVSESEIVDEKYALAAKATITKNKRINIRLTEKVYHAIQAKALEEGIPYQTLISSIIQKYTQGKLKSV